MNLLKKKIMCAYKKCLGEAPQFICFDRKLENWLLLNDQLLIIQTTNKSK